MERFDIPSAVAYFRRGGLLIYPTETAYALGCDATNAKAVRAIFRLKGRERGKPLPLIVASLAMAERYARFTSFARQLASKHWPGALTLIVARRSNPTFSPPLPEGEREGEARTRTLAPGIIALDGSIALRISSHPTARALSRALNRPIVSTSANQSGTPPCYSVRSALRSLQRTRKVRPHFSGPDVGVAVLDVGTLPRRRPSTIVDARGDRVTVLRQGSVRVH